MHETCENCTTTFSVGLKSCPNCQTELKRSVNDPAPVEDDRLPGESGVSMTDVHLPEREED